MALNALQDTAQRNGQLVYAMRQATTPTATQPGPWGRRSSAGYCAGLCIRWTALRYAGHDYLFDARTREVTNPDWQAVRDQSIYTDALDKPGSAFPGNLKAVYAEYGLTLNRGLVTELSMPMSAWNLHSACATRAGCYFVGLHGLSAHAVAVQKTEGTGWRFFDANFGCFLLADDKAFKDFVTWFMQESGYLRTNHLDRSFKVVGIDPPPFTGTAFQVVMSKLVERYRR